MKELDNEYTKMKEIRKKIKNEIKLLEEDKNVKKYIELKKMLNYSLCNEQYDLCKHVLVYSKVYDDKNKRCGCIKCGLDESVLDENRDDLSLKNKIMYDYLKNHHSRIDGINTGNKCDLSLAQAIYFKLKEVYPNINDLTAIKYYEIALDNIRNIDVSKKRKESRAKRLSLKPNFNNWDAEDICIKN
ncbi:MAG: hypothetical protein VZS44_01405 [Bacilli bacterium]|nr:hypothetical protein [Bacilli bacterium]